MANREPTIMLLPTHDEARLIRRALNYWKDEMTTGAEEEDRAWKIISDISTKLTRE